MKKVNLIIQSKGGVGKSLLVWFIAQLEKDKPTAFIDLDESTLTTANRLGKIVGENRVRHFKILNENKKLEREKILNLFEVIASTKTSTWYIDFGAPESEEFKRLLSFDIEAEPLVEELKSIGIELNLLIVIAGRDALVSCLNYYQSIKSLAGEALSFYALVNEGTFGGIEAVTIGKKALQQAGIKFLPFGGLGDSESGKEIIQLITDSKEPQSLHFASRLLFKKVIAQIQEILTHCNE